MCDHQGRAPSAVEKIRGEPWSYFEGDPFLDDELQGAARYLKGRELVGGYMTAHRDDPLRPQITDDGRACVEQYDGSVVAWEQRDRAAPSTHVTTHFHDRVSGQVGIAGGDVHPA